MTRDQATTIARNAAVNHGRHHAYVGDVHPADLEPHEWVIEAILAAANQETVSAKSQDVELYGERLEGRVVLDCTMTFNGLPVRVTGFVATAPGNWDLILSAPGELPTPEFTRET